MLRFVFSLGVLLAVTAGVMQVLPRSWLVESDVSYQPRSMMASGFVNDHGDAAPTTWLWSDFIPLRVDDPENTNIVIWNHGTEAFEGTPSCLGKAYYPPPSIMALERIGKTRIYYLCTKSENVRGKRHFALQRGDEIVALVKRFRALGVPAYRIFVAGQSGGSCSSLFALGRAPRQMNAGILFATACFGPGEGLKRRQGKLSRASQQVLRQMTAARSVEALLVTFKGDKWNKPGDLRFLTRRWPGRARIFSPPCRSHHSGAYFGCGVKPVGKAVRAYFRKRLAAGKAAHEAALRKQGAGPGPAPETSPAPPVRPVRATEDG